LDLPGIIIKTRVVSAAPIIKPAASSLRRPNLNDRFLAELVALIFECFVLGI